MATYIGIDPGLTGAIVQIAEDIVLVYDMPTKRVGSKKVLDIFTIKKLFDSFAGRPDQLVTMEVQAPRPGQRARATFTLGYGYGVLETLVVTSNMPYQLVLPPEWKGTVLAGHKVKNKETARHVAAQLFPTIDLGTRKDEGRADALLLAEYGRRTRSNS